MAYYGYHRTSTKEQHLDRGIIEIQRFCESQNIKLAGIFTDKLTGKNFDRPRYTVLVEDVLREGDTLIITELDRLGRNKQEILKQLQILKDKGVRVMVLELPTTLIDLSQMDNALAKTVEFDTMIVVLWWYVIVTTIFAAIRSETFLGDFTVFVDTVWNGICQSGKWIVDVGNALAQAGDRIPNETMAIVAHWLLFIIVIVGAAVAVGVLMVIGEKKVTKVYRENCWDVISVGEAVTSVALVVYFGDWIKAFVKLNLVVLLLLVQAVYVGIRAYVKGCKRARGYY
ncbi:DUF6040 family protein [Blautia wexlerae]